jgi:hypothetical protein
MPGKRTVSVSGFGFGLQHIASTCKMGNNVFTGTPKRQRSRTAMVLLNALCSNFESVSAKTFQETNFSANLEKAQLYASICFAGNRTDRNVM